MKCTCMVCGKEYENQRDYKTSICYHCLMLYKEDKRQEERF